MSDSVLVLPAGTTSKQGTLLTHLIYPRYGHTATVLPDGTVAIFGGTGSDGKIVTAAEIIDPATGETRIISDPGLTPRTDATATLLTDGAVLLVGGLGADGEALTSAQLWDLRAGQVDEVRGTLATPRSSERSSLLANGDVLIWGGRDDKGETVTTAELYDPNSGTFSAISPDDARLSLPYSASGVPSVVASLPAADAMKVAVDSRVALRSSSPLALSPGASNAISLVGPAGAVSGKAVAAEGGKLLFFTPSVDLLPGATYTIFLQGAIDAGGRGFPFSTSSFTTETIKAQQSSASLAATSQGRSTSAQPSRGTIASPAITIATLSAAQTPSSSEPPQQAQSPGQKASRAPEDDAGPEDWIPTEKNRHGNWRVLGLAGDPSLHRAAAALAPLTAPAGQTAVAGEVLRYNGTPIPGVTVSMDGKSGVTDSTGRFLLSGVTPGIGQLEVDGTGVLQQGRHYTKHFMREELTAGTTTVVRNPIYLPRVDPATEVSIPSPTTKEIVLTNAEIPGLEVHIPKGVVLREYNGKIVRKVSITPIPLDRPPYPAPVSFAVYFTLQPGGAFLDAPADKAIRVIYPNYQGLPPGTRADFWNYDPDKGWQVYGQGTVTADGKQVVPDANVGFRQIISFGMGLGPGTAPPPKGPPVNGCVQGGDPVDCATGLFLHTETDLAIRDTIPISVTRTYRQNDSMSRSFGIGTNLSYNMWLYTPTSGSVPPEVDLILSDGSRVPYFLESGNALSNAIWKQTSAPSVFYDSVLTSFNNGSGSEGFTITLRDQTVLTFARHAPNGILSITDRNGNSITFTVTDSTTGGTITRVNSPSGRYIQFYYDSANRITQATDNIGRSVYYSYDSAGRLSSVKDPAGNTESYGYNDSNQMTTVTDKRGNVMVTNQYDSNGRVSQQTLADGAVWKFAYQLDEADNVTQTTVTDPRQVERQDTFNSDGYLTQQIRAVGRPEQQTISIQRDANNQVLSFIDALGRTTQLSRDGVGNVTGITRLAGTSNAVTDSFTYDSIYQQLTSYTDPLDHTTRLGLDALGNVTSVTDAAGNTVQIANDSLGRPTAITNALGKVTQISYDLGDLSSVTDPLGRTVSLFTDAVGRVTGVSDPLGHITQYTYDAMDNVVQIIDPKGGITSLGYDPNGNLLSVQGPRSVGAYSFSYDLRNRVHTYTDPLGKTATYNYDGMGDLTSKIDRNNQTTSYAYDALDRLQTVTYADSSTINVTWDGGNRPTQIADSADGTITRQYDGLDRLTEEVSPQGQVDYQYDTASRRTQLTVTGLSAVGYQYDAANRLTQIAQGTTTVGLGYDAADRRASVTLPNGVVESYSYDDADELTGINYDHGTTHLGDLSYSYDQAGRRVSESGSLASLAIPSSVSSASYDADNRLTNWNGVPLMYDANGNLSSYGSSSYSWNTRDELTGTSDGGGSFSYDALGRRTSQTVVGVSTPYLYDGENPATVSGYMLLNGLGIDERFAQTSPEGVTSYLSDALGSTIGVTDASGSMVGSYSYAAYGGTSFAGSVATPFEFTGRENDGATNLYYNRARYYSPELGRFISQDPSGFGGGLDFYAYADGDPIDFVDPYGLYCLSPQAISGLAGAAGGAFSGAIALAEGGPLGLIAGGLLGGAFGGAFGYFGPTNSWNALAVGAATGLSSGLNTPGGSVVGGAVGGAVSWSMRSYGAGDLPAGLAGGAAGGFAAGFTSAFFSSGAPGSVSGAVSAAIRAGGPGALVGLSGAAVSAAVEAALVAGNDCGCGK